MELDVVSLQFFIQSRVIYPEKFCCALLMAVALGQNTNQDALFDAADEFLEWHLLPDTKVLDKKLEDLLAECPLFPFVEILRAYLFDRSRII